MGVQQDDDGVMITQRLAKEKGRVFDFNTIRPMLND
jgi:hypothetical protein